MGGGEYGLTVDNWQITLRVSEAGDILTVAAVERTSDFTFRKRFNVHKAKLRAAESPRKKNSRKKLKQQPPTTVERSEAIEIEVSGDTENGGPMSPQTLRKRQPLIFASSQQALEVEEMLSLSKKEKKKKDKDKERDSFESTLRERVSKSIDNFYNNNNHNNNTTTSNNLLVNASTPTSPSTPTPIRKKTLASVSLPSSPAFPPHPFSPRYSLLETSPTNGATSPLSPLSPTSTSTNNLRRSSLSPTPTTTSSTYLIPIKLDLPDKGKEKVDITNTNIDTDRDTDAMKKEVENIIDLAEELQLHILSFLTPIHLSMVSRVCRSFRTLSRDDTLWRSLFNTYFGGSKKRGRTWRQESMHVMTRVSRHARKCQEETLLWGAKHGHTKLVERLVTTHRLDVNIIKRDKSAASPLHLACHEGHLETVQLLVDVFKANVNARTNYGRTPLERAAKNGHTRVVEFLISNNADVNAAPVGGETPLLVAALNNHADIVKVLLEHGADANASRSGFTALRIATLQGYSEIVNLLAGKLIKHNKMELEDLCSRSCSLLREHEAARERAAKEAVAGGSGGKGGGDGKGQTKGAGNGTA